MKFTHMADVHIGGWREPKLSFLSLEAFKQAIDQSISSEVDFVIIAGDLFNTSVPGIDYIKEVVNQLMKLKNKNIPVYIVPGSHDFSPSGKTMLDVLENAGLLINVVKAKKLSEDKFELLFTQDLKTQVKITGMLGKKNMLEKSYYKSIDYTNLNSEDGFKIFIFHTALDEFKSEDLSSMESSPLSFLPPGFDYYAGGHVHIIDKKSFENHKNVVYPGPTFPNSFSELEKLKHGGYFLYDNGDIQYQNLELKKTLLISLDCNNKTPEQVNSELDHNLKLNDFKDKIVLIRIKGKLKLGKLLDISLKTFIKSVYELGGYFVMKNTSGLNSADFEEIKKNYNPESIEEEIVNEHLGQIKIEGIDVSNEKTLILSLIEQLSKEKSEGETNTTYEERILKDINLID
jgi:DNA repair protein SbcD/Mre11